MDQVLDTNILISGKIPKGIVIYPVLRELDRLKVFSDTVGKQSRDALHAIHQKPDHYPMVYFEQKENESVDDCLVRFCLENDYTLNTLDLSLHLKALTKKCKSNFAYNGNYDYGGITYLEGEDEADFFSRNYTVDHPINHFLVSGKRAFIKTACGYEEISYGSIKNNQSGTIVPRNIEQYCLMELLLRDVPVISATGSFGAGKSMFLLNYALQLLDENQIEKIVIVPNNSSTENTMDVGTLPGELEDKFMPYLNVLLDSLPRFQIEKMIQTDRIQVIPMAVLRGRNIENAVIWVQEAQNLTADHMKLLLGRVAEGTRLFVDGDPVQSDKRIFTSRSGIKLLNKLALTDSADLFGTVKLKKTERSKIAQLADLLSSME